MRRVMLPGLFALALFGAACGHAVAPAPATASDRDDTPDPGVHSPLRHPV
jgi:hypothetical protein